MAQPPCTGEANRCRQGLKRARTCFRATATSNERRRVNGRSGMGSTLAPWPSQDLVQRRFKRGEAGDACTKRSVSLVTPPALITFEGRRFRISPGPVSQGCSIVTCGRSALWHRVAMHRRARRDLERLSFCREVVWLTEVARKCNACWNKETRLSRRLAIRACVGRTHVRPRKGPGYTPPPEPRRCFRPSHTVRLEAGTFTRWLRFCAN